jgi:hypothetical protein
MHNKSQHGQSISNLSIACHLRDVSYIPRTSPYEGLIIIGLQDKDINRGEFHSSAARSNWV